MQHEAHADRRRRRLLGRSHRTRGRTGAEDGALDYLVFECLAERTIALAQQARRLDPERGYDPLLEARMRAVLPLAAANGVRIVSNMGAANPVAAARRTADIAREARFAAA